MTDRITLAGDDGRHFEAGRDETLLAAALRQGIVIPHNCRNGFCGSCKGRVLSGEVDRGEVNPAVLDAQEAADGYVLCCRARPLGDITLEVETIATAGDVEIKTLPCRVQYMERLSDDVMRIDLKLPPNEALAFHAGQYIDILLPDGRRRSFSMASSPAVGNLLELHIRHVPGGEFTGRVFRQMQPKEMLRIQGPFGTFFLRDVPEPAVLIGGGTGLAPLKSMLEEVREQGCLRPLHLFWGVRARADLYLHDILRRWAEELECLTYTPVLSEPAPGDDWQGATGWVHEAVLAAFPDLTGFEVYASGPPPMIEAIRAAFPRHGLAPGRLYYDSFDYAEDRR